ALPGTTIDWRIHDGIKDIPIEQRAPDEVTHLNGKTATGDLQHIQITADGCQAANPAFDITPARLITGLITERGICKASAAGLSGLFPEQ
ncbi:MAG TPA: S-methyl-5-thioribose-1-phosphate isomerase, partial [Gammaproteobacteria bacterium]|nr:S-methyl-5-thioribose-1-phosphate isomerase [Gammaproteobacteria bacterium]